MALKSRSTIRVGTSGWHYRHWTGAFYPSDLRPQAYLELYARHFDTVELNNTFYRLPKLETFNHWRDTTPDDFLFACKASGFITHRKRLKEPKVSCKAFFDAVEGLGGKCGPILFQLPPRWHVNLERLAAFLEALPARPHFAFEFRDESWFHSGIYDLLRRHKAAFCIYDLAGRLSPLEVTADFVYLRLHGPGAAYQGSYGKEALAGWAERLLTWRKAGLDCFVYFDNDEKAYAVRNALRLRAMIAGSD